MFVAQESATIVLHVAPTRSRESDSGEPHGDPPTECDLQHYRWYTQYLEGARRPLLVLLPACWRMAEQRLREVFGAHPICWYEDAVEVPPEVLERRQVWIVSAHQRLVIDWPAAEAVARKREVDVLLLGSHSSRSETHYSESVVVDPEGRVLRFRRHYFDSSAFAAKWAGPPGFMVIPARHSVPVINHLIARGWDLESIGGLALSFTLGWAENPCVLGAGRSSQPVDDEAAELEASSNLLSPLLPDVLEQAAEEVANTEADPTYLFLKRSLDFTASAVGLLALSPLLALTALMVKLTSRGPVLFGHKRQGLGGREFICWKFRSMRVGADAMQAQLRALNEVDGPQFKIKADPRITPIGSLLRKTNIDELPQLINVLLGQMSLVGPRPSPDRENQLCPAWRRARLSVKPGITGLWQVLRRRDESASDFQEWIYYDVEYAKHRSLWLDIRILLYTPVAILAPQRASALARRLQKFGVCAYSPRICPSTVEVGASSLETNLNPTARALPVGNGAMIASNTEESAC